MAIDIISDIISDIKKQRRRELDRLHALLLTLHRARKDEMRWIETENNLMRMQIKELGVEPVV